MRGHHAFLSSLTPFQRQIWPRCRARPRARGMELSTVPHGCTRTCWGDARLRGQRQGPWRSHPAPSVRCPSVRHRSQHNRGRSRQTSPAGGLARTTSPGTWTASLALSLFPSLGTPSPAPASPGSKALQSRHHKREGIPHTCPSPISQGCTWHHSGVYEPFLFWKSCRSAAFCSIFPIPASRRFSRAPWAFSEMSNPRRSPQHLQCFVTALAKC